MSLVVSASSTVWFKKKVSVGAGQTVVIDSVNESTFLRIHYKIALKNSSGTLVRSFDYDAHKVSGSISDRVSGKMGAGISYAVSGVLSSGSLELSITNSEAFDISVGFARILISA